MYVRKLLIFVFLFSSYFFFAFCDCSVAHVAVLTIVVFLEVAARFPTNTASVQTKQ